MARARPARNLSERHTDLLFEVQTREGAEAFVYVLFEHQSTPDPQMPLRLYTYVERIWRRWSNDNPAARHLPMIAPVVLYHGQQPWSAPLSLAEMIPGPARPDGRLHPADFEYTLVDLSDVSADVLWGKALARLALWLLKHGWEGRLWRRLPHWVDTLAEVLDESGLRAVDTVLRYVVEVDAEQPGPRARRMLRERVGPRAEEVVMGWAQTLREEGREQGREQERGRLRETLVQLLEQRFDTVSDAVRARIAAASSDELWAWTSRVLVAESAEDVLRG